jgi:uncharacterized protein YjdB
MRLNKWSLLALVVLTSVCGGDSMTGPVPSTPTGSVSVSLGAASLTVGGTTQATATNRDAAGNVLTGRPVTWTSSNPAVATVSASGGVAAVGAGTATITATSEGQTGSAALTVTPVPTASVSVSLGAASLTVGGTTQATATNRDAAGNVLTGRLVTWTSSNPAVATVSASGGVAAVGAGTATITATSEGQTGSATLTVTPTAANCGASGLVFGQQVTGTIQQSQCAVTDNFFGSRSFTGPESGGTYFYNLYTIDVAANTVAQVSTTRGTLPPGAILLAFDQSGAVVTRGSFDAAITLNNSTTATKRFQVLVTTSNPGATGTYTLSRGP